MAGTRADPDASAKKPASKTLKGPAKKTARKIVEKAAGTTPSGTGKTKATGTQRGKKDRKAPGMRYPKSLATGDLGMVETKRAVLRELKWIFRDQTETDMGIDGHLETVVGDDRFATGRLVALQIKAGDSWFREQGDDGSWLFRSDTAHLRYWLSHSLPVLIVLVDSDGDAYWEELTLDKIVESDTGFSMRVSFENQFDDHSRAALLEIAGRHDENVELKIKTRYEALPADTNLWLRKAFEKDPMRTARVAEHLGDGRRNPESAATSLVRAQPTWIVDSPARYELWMATAAYALAHELPSVASSAFEHAAEDDTSGSARAWAYAALTAYAADDVDRARNLCVRSATAGGGRFTDVVTALTTLPRDSADVVATPASVAAATEEKLDQDSNVRNFLAEMALRRGELDEAVRQRQRGAETTTTSSHQPRMMLAATLLRRAQNDGGGLRADTRAALVAAHEALTEVRRFGGPSHLPLELVLDILTVVPDFDEAVRLALPISAGGTATDAEAATPGVARRGAVAAVARGRHDDLAAFLENLPDGPAHEELQALRESGAGTLSRADETALWADLVTTADSDTMKARCCHHLVWLGQWPDQIQDLVDRKILPALELDILGATHEYVTGDRLKATRTLTRLADKTARAGFELARLVREHEDPDSAIQVCRDQLARWNDPGLSALLAEILTSEGRDEEALEHLTRQVGNDALAVGLRQDMALWVIRHRMRQHAPEGAVDVSRAAIELGPNDELVFASAALLEVLGRYSEASRLLKRHNPLPTTDQEVRLWMQLILGAVPTPWQLTTMVALARGRTDQELRRIIVSRLKSELDAPRDAPLPDDVTSAIELLLEETNEHDLITPDELDDALRQPPSPDLFVRLLPEALAGRRPWADVADGARFPYTAMLVRRPGDVFVSQDLAPAIRDAGKNSASEALERGSCVLDLSSVYLLALLGDTLAEAVTSHLEPTLASRSVRDIAMTSDGLRFERLGGTAVTTGPSGVRRIQLPVTEALYWETIVTRMSKLAASMATRLAGADAGRINPAEEALLLARESASALWCDDSALRQRARGRGLSSFSTLELLDALAERGVAFEMAVVRRDLALNRVVDLALGASDIAALGSTAGWTSAPVTAALIRVDWWNSLPDWEDVWFDIARAARLDSRDALEHVTLAAIGGAVAAATPGLATQRHMRIVLLALLACRQESRPAPVAFPRRVAQQRPDGEAPWTGYLLEALREELALRGADDPAGAAVDLLPGMDFLT
ncbi:MAG: hypothetical protein JWM02_1399 [Frankiales bacterium]|nr:hypothetical protein [Frankiales bacterium]